MTVREYGNQSYTVKALSGYAVERVLVDGKDIGAVSSYRFERVTRDHTIEVFFKPTAAAPAPEKNPQTGAYAAG